MMMMMMLMMTMMTMMMMVTVVGIYDRLLSLGLHLDTFSVFVFIMVSIMSRIALQIWYI